MKLPVWIILILLFTQCKKPVNTLPVIPCDPTISYSTRVKAIFITNCTSSGCHDGVSFPSLSDYNVAHDASGQIRTAVSRDLMPLHSTLSAEDKAAILCWIDSGAKNN